MSSRQQHKEMTETPSSENRDTVDLKLIDSIDVDWRNSKTVGECLSHLYLSQQLSDITFTFKSHKNVQIPAHKFVLSMRSSVFEAMFHGPLAEVGNTVLIEEIKPETMKALLGFVYSDDPKLDGNNVLPCLYAAKKYALAGCVKQCSSFLESNIDSSNVCGIHEQAVFYNMQPLVTKCFDYILENASKVLSSEGFLEVSHATLLKLLEHDELAEDELNVFNAAIKWSKANCQSRNVTPNAQHMRECLGEALFAIRFPIIPIADFARVVTPVGVLTSQEQIMLYQYNATSSSSLLTKFPVRNRLMKNEITINVSGYPLHEKQMCYCYHLEIKKELIYEKAESSFRRREIVYEYQLENEAKGIEAKIEMRLMDEKDEHPYKLRIKSVTGTFVKNVERITTQRGSVFCNFRIVGDTLIFQTPIEIDGMIKIDFLTDADDHRARKHYTTKRKTLQKMSGKLEYQSNSVNITGRVNKRSIFITKIPFGMKTITFIW